MRSRFHKFRAQWTLTRCPRCGRERKILIHWTGCGVPRIFCNDCHQWIADSGHDLADDLIFEDSGRVDFNIIEDELGELDYGPSRQKQKN
jgi:hypothetical protein